MAKQPTRRRSWHALKNKFGHKPQPVIEGLVHRRSITAIAAGSGTGKTTLIGDLSARLMAGVSTKELPILQAAPVMAVMPESHEVIVSSIQGAMANHKINETIVEKRFWPVSTYDAWPWVQPTHTDFLNKMDEELAEAERACGGPVRMIFFDSAQFMTPKSVSDDVAAKEVIEPIRILAQKHDLGVVIALHNDKVDGDFIGSQAWHASADIFGMLQKEGINGRFLGDNAKGRLKDRHRVGFVGLGYTGVEVDGHIQLSSFEKRATKKTIPKKKTAKKATKKRATSKSKKAQDQTASGVRRDALGYKADRYYKDDGSKNVPIDQLWRDAKAFGWTKSNRDAIHPETEAQLKRHMAALGWAISGDSFTRS